MSTSEHVKQVGGGHVTRAAAELAEAPALVLLIIVVAWGVAIVGGVGGWNELVAHDDLIREGPRCCRHSACSCSAGR